MRAARTFAASYFASSVGLGMYVPGSTVYFVRSVGFRPVQVGVGLSIAGLLGLICGMPVGSLADRFGPREVTLGLTAAGIPLVLAITQIRSFWQFALVIGPLAVAQGGADVSREALIGALFGHADSVRVAAVCRVALNAGFSVGLAGAGLVIAIGTRPAYVSLFAACAGTAAVAAVLTRRLPRVPGVARGTANAGAHPLHDLRYLIMAQVSGLTRLCDTMLTVGLPLWVVGHTAAPRPLAAWLIIVNTAIVMLFQVRATKGCATIDGAGRMQRRAFAVLAVSCVLLDLSSGVAAGAATSVLVAGTVALTLGEMWGEGAWWALRYGLTPATAQGRYGGVFNLGLAVPAVCGPAAVTYLIGVPHGWLALTVVFGAATIVNRSVVARAAEVTRC